MNILDEPTYEAGSFYIIDRGYLDFARLHRLHSSSAFFVTRAKQNFRSALWSAILCWVGVTMGKDEQLKAGNLHRISYWGGGIVFALTTVYYWFVYRVMKKRQPGQTADP